MVLAPRVWEYGVLSGTRGPMPHGEPNKRTQPSLARGCDTERLCARHDGGFNRATGPSQHASSRDRLCILEAFDDRPESLRQRLLQLLLLCLEAFAQIVKHLLRPHVGDMILCGASAIKQQNAHAQNTS